jgi:hypothetical protein
MLIMATVLCISCGTAYRSVESAREPSSIEERHDRSNEELMIAHHTRRLLKSKVR